jgi:ankyrin repeat protein
MTSKSLELLEAVAVGDLDRVRSLVESGADVNSADEHGSGTLLNFHPRITAYLLSQGANPNAQTNENGVSVLAGLCFVNESECAKLLLAHGADVNRGRDESKETPLHHALAGQADIEVIRLLVDHGADVNAKSVPGVCSFNFYGNTPTRGETPLHRAAAFASIEIVQLLLRAGADRTIQDVHGETPHVWAGWHRREKVLVEVLRPS